MAIRSASLLALGCALLLAVPSHGETLHADGEATPDVINGMMNDFKMTTGKILPGVSPTEVFPTVESAFQVLSGSYNRAALQPFAISVNEAEIQKTFNGQDSSAAIYGELLPQSAAAMLAFALKNNENIVWDRTEHHRYEVKTGAVEARPKFFDLGSGFGKISELAALLGFDAGGYELTRPRIKAACDALAKLADSGASSGGAVTTGSEVADAAASPRELCDLEASEGHGHLEFFLGSFTHESVNLEDADVIFTDSVFWSEETMKELGAKAGKMKPGSIIVSYKSFPGPNFENLENLNLPTSWSSGTTFKVQRVVKPKETTNLRGLQSKN